MHPVSRRLAARVLPLLVLLTLAAALPAGAAVFSRVPPRGAQAPTALAARVPANTTLLRLDPAELASFREAGGGTLEIPTEQGALRLQLTPWDITDGQGVTITDERGQRPAGVDVTLYRGTVVGEPEGWAVIALSPDAAQGTVSTRAGRLQLSPTEAPRKGFTPLHALGPESIENASAKAWECGVDGGQAEPQLRGPERRTAIDARQLTTTLLGFQVAVDCDYEIYANKFASNLTNATQYILTVLGTVSLIYQRDLDVKLTYPYLNLWTTSSDPYNQTTTGNQLPEFRTWWIANRAGVNRSIAHLISGRPLGGGIAYVDQLCTSFGYGVSAIDATYSYPTNSTTWDVEVIAHEMGHNFGSPHTHNCYWQSAGYVAPGATLDSCQASEGGCSSYITHVPPDKGTIMSYCHLAGGINAIRLEFHPFCKIEMRGSAEAAGCQQGIAFQPPTGLTSTATSTGATLSWIPSAAPGVIGYDVHRSLFAFDLNTPFRASALGSSLPDSAFGTYYYRVRAVRSADSSDWSGELKSTLCGLTYPVSYPTGLNPVAAVRGDFNEDGIEDVATANFDGNSMSVLLGQGSAGVGNGTFGSATTVGAGFGPLCIASGDWNGDGITDLAVGNNFDLSVTIYLGQGSGGVGDGTFVSTYTRSGVPDPASMAVADFNEDGIADIAVAGGGSECTILLGQGSGGIGDGTFSIGSTLFGGSAPQGVSAGDFNEDGIWDLVVIGNTGARIFLGNGSAGKGDGTFTQNTTYPCGPGASSVLVTDWNADGISDLGVTVNAGVVVLLGQGSGGVGNGAFSATTTYGSGAFPNALKSIDWNGDGVPDATVANSSTTNTATVLLGNRSGGTALGTLGGAFPFPGGDTPRALVPADVNEDGAPDLIVVNRTGNKVSVLRGSCSTVLATALNVVSPNGAESWSAGDEHVISWTRGAGVFAVHVQLSTDGGANWHTIAENATDSTFKWTVTEPITPQARVRIVDPMYPNRHDESDADFAILPPGSTGVPQPGARSLALAGAFPNPARHQLGVTFVLPDGRPATLELLDLAGRRVGGSAVGALGAGVHRVLLAPAQRLHPGLYLVRLSHPDGVRSLKVAFLE